MAKKDAIAAKYSKDELRGLSESLFNVKPEIIDGALCGNTKTEFSVEEMQEEITNFLGKVIE